MPQMRHAGAGKSRGTGFYRRTRGVSPDRIRGRRKNSWIIGAAAAAAVALIVILVVVLGQPKKINLEKYVEINFSGYNTKGRAEVSIQWEELSEKLMDILDGNSGALLAATGTVQVSLDQDSGLVQRGRSDGGNFL